MRPLQGRLVLITGAASGIGRATAVAFAREGACLILSDIQEAGLLETKSACVGSPSVETHLVDVSDRGAMKTFAELVHAKHSAVDVLVNNAGVAVSGGFLQTTLEDWDWLLGINVLGVVHGCFFFLPPMVRQRHGHVVNVSSVAGYFASSSMSAYAATKFAVLGLSEALRDELMPHGIGVTAICPGIVDTAIVKTARYREGSRDEVANLYEKRGFGPEKVAAAIIDSVKRNVAVRPVTPEAWLLYVMKRLSPGLVAWVGSTVVKRLNKK